MLLGLAGIFIIPAGTAAQNISSEKNITAHYDSLSLKEVIKEISKKTQIRFSYSPEQIDENRKITVSFENLPLHLALDKLFMNMPIRYEWLDEYIILTRSAVKSNTSQSGIQIKHVLSGYIRDSSSGEFLPGATIYLKDQKIGTTTNSYGFFSLSLPEGKYEPQVSFIGYERLQNNISLFTNTRVDLELSPRLQKLDEVIVSQIQAEDVNFKRRASQSSISSASVARAPSLLGEPDVLKSLEFQPGIVFYGDGSSYFHVRGGNYDQNLVILDEATIFNPSHLLGLFSPIIPDAIKSADIYKGDFPVNFGGRLSSIIDIHSKDGNKNQFSASGNIGIISSRGTIEGPIEKGESSYFISFRKSYFDAYLKTVLPALQSLYFYDFTAKINLKISSNDRIFLTLYNGKDVLRIKQGTDDNAGINWDNLGSTFRWNHIIGSNAFLNSSVSVSNYDYRLYTSLNNNWYWDSRITHVALKEELSYFINPNFTWKSGLEVSFYDFNPGNYYVPSNAGNVQVSPVKSDEVVLYSGVEQTVHGWLQINYGMRLRQWTNLGAAFVVQYDANHTATAINYYQKNEPFYTHASLEPRLSASIKTGKFSSLKFSYCRNYQYLNLISNTISPFNSLEVWLPSGPNIKPQYADIYDLGFMTSLGLFDFRTDLYYKKLFNQIGYKYEANMLINPFVEGEIRQGKGSSYGIEFSIIKSIGNFSGQISYTYSRSMLQIEDLNNNRWFPSNFDRPQNFALNLSWQLKPRWTLDIDYHVMSGLRFTSPSSFYNYRGIQVPLYTEQNNDQLPAYSRFDISTTIRLNKKEQRFNHSLNFSILNLFGKKNPIFIYFNKTKSPDGKLLIPADTYNMEILTSSIRYTYGIIPSVSYQFRF